METMIDFIFILIINLFDIYIVYRCMSIFFSDTNFNKKLCVTIYLCSWFLGTFLNFIVPYPVITISFSLFSYFIISLCYNSKLSKKLLVTLTIFLLSTISESIIAIALHLNNFNLFQKSDYGNIFMHIITNIIFWTTTLLLQKLKGIRLNVKLPKLFIISTIIVPVSSVIIEFIILNQNLLNRNLAILSLFCISASTFITIYLYDSYSDILQQKAQSELTKRENNYYKNQSELLQNNYNELRQFRHNMLNRIISIQQMLEQQEYERIQEYTNSMIQKITNTKSYSTTGNFVIDSIINYKLSVAANKGINVTADLTIPEHLDFIKDDDIIVIIGNLLDYAIEASESVTEKKHLTLTIQYITGCLYIQTKSSFNPVVHDYNHTLSFRKENDITHDIGFKSIQAAADRYNGYVDYSSTEKEFEVFVMLYSTDTVK